MSKPRTRYFEYHDDRSNKFWEITLDGRSYTARWGKIGSVGQSKTRIFSSEELAKEAANTLMLQKHKKGYAHLGDQRTHEPNTVPESSAASGAYWGGLQRDCRGFESARKFVIPLFNLKRCVGLGSEDDGSGELSEPTEQELAELAADFQQFLASVKEHHTTIHKHAFTLYQKIYAPHFENEKRSGVAPRGILTVEDHQPHLNLCEVRVQKGAIRLIFDYAFDPEHGLEVVFKDNTFWDSGGISDVLR